MFADGQRAAASLQAAGAWEFLDSMSAACREQLLAGVASEATDAAAAHLLQQAIAANGGFARLQTAGRILLAQPGPASEPTSAGALAPAALSLLVRALSRCKDSDGGPVLNIEVPEPPACSYCSLTVSGARPDGSALEHEERHPYDAAAHPAGPEEELLGQLLLRSVVPPRGRPGFVHFVQQRPCGHWLHEHCYLKLYLDHQAGALARTCPACDCECDGYGPGQWIYGYSGTRAELLGVAGEAEDEGLADIDPRSLVALFDYLPERLQATAEAMYEEDQVSMYGTGAGGAQAPLICSAPPLALSHLGCGSLGASTTASGAQLGFAPADAG